MNMAHSGGEDEAPMNTKYGDVTVAGHEPTSPAPPVDMSAGQQTMISYYLTERPRVVQTDGISAAPAAR